MIAFIKNLFLRLLCKIKPEEIKINSKEIKLRYEILKKTDMGYVFSQTLEDMLTHLMSQNYEDVIERVGTYYIEYSIGKDSYKIWNSNYPYGWLNRAEKNSREIFKDRKPNLETMIQFKLWLDNGVERVKEKTELNNKINSTIWRDSIEKYWTLKNNSHYSHHTVKSYIDEITELYDKCKETMTIIEINDTIMPHVKQLNNIVDKATVELQKFLKEQKEKEELELQKAKDAYKSAVMESSELLKARYSEYTKDFQLEE